MQDKQKISIQKGSSRFTTIIVISLICVSAFAGYLLLHRLRMRAEEQEPENYSLRVKQIVVREDDKFVAIVVKKRIPKQVAVEKIILFSLPEMKSEYVYSTTGREIYPPFWDGERLVFTEVWRDTASGREDSEIKEIRKGKQGWETHSLIKIQGGLPFAFALPDKIYVSEGRKLLKWVHMGGKWQSYVLFPSFKPVEEGLDKIEETPIQFLRSQRLVLNGGKEMLLILDQCRVAKEETKGRKYIINELYNPASSYYLRVGLQSPDKPIKWLKGKWIEGHPLNILGSWSPPITRAKAKTVYYATIIEKGKNSSQLLLWEIGVESGEVREKEWEVRGSANPNLYITPWDEVVLYPSSISTKRGSFRVFSPQGQSERISFPFSSLGIRLAGFHKSRKLLVATREAIYLLDLDNKEVSRLQSLNDIQ